MKTSFEEIMNEDFENFVDEDMGGICNLNFESLGGVPGGRKYGLREFWRRAVEKAISFNMLDYLVFSSPAAALAAIIFIARLLMERVQSFMHGM
jgi:hypothetical protein